MIKSCDTCRYQFPYCHEDIGHCNQMRQPKEPEKSCKTCKRHKMPENVCLQKPEIRYDMKAKETFACWEAKMEKIQMTEEQAISLLSEVSIYYSKFGLTDGINIQNSLRNWKIHGYIKQNPVEEAEEMYKHYTEEHEFDIHIATFIHKQHEAIQHLKSEIERMKEGK